MRFRSATPLVAMTILVLVLTACGATSSPSASVPSSTGSSTEPGASGPAAGGVPERVLNYAYHKAWPTLDPTNSWDSEPDVLAMIYETLTTFNTTTGELGPGLATEWEHNDDGTDWTFHLREGVTFHDGAPLTADAVIASLERNAVGNGPQYLYTEYDSMDAPDDLTVHIITKVPQPLDWMLSAGWGAYIVSPDTVEQPQEWFETGQGAGTGPYKWTSYEPGVSATIDYFPDYWGGWEADQVATVNYTFVSDAATRQQMLEQGQVNLAWSLPTHSLPTLAENPDLALYSYPILAAQTVLFNTVRAPTDDKFLRLAAAAAFPTDDIISTVYGGETYVTKNVSSYASLTLGGGVDGDGFTFDLDQARDYLSQSGYPDGGVSFDMVVNNAFPDQQQEAELWKANLAEIGVDLEILLVDSNQYTSIAHADVAERPSFFSSWTPDYPSPQNQMFAKFGSTSSANDSSYVNEDFDALLAQGVEEFASDRDAANATFAEANDLLFQDMPGFPYLDKLVTFVTASNVTGVDVQHCGLLDIYKIRISG